MNSARDGKSRVTYSILSAENLNLIASAVGQYEAIVYQPLPMHTSALSGDQYIKEVLSSRNPERLKQVLRMPADTFRVLCQLLRSRTMVQDTNACNISITVEEQLAMFMKVVAENASNRVVQERFQHSGDTVSRHFNSILDALVSFYPDYITPATPMTPPEILHNPKLYPYFKDCIGALDGTHIRAKVPVAQSIPFRNRKGEISQNVLAACKFNLQFSYVLPGWEGSAHDARVLQYALSNDFVIPENKYFLADAGYGLRKGILTPYRGVRYHLREHAQSGTRPETKEELFNLRHSQLRNAVERIFGVLKRRFPILTHQPEYPYQTQVKLVIALTTLQNFIRKHSPENEIEYWERMEQIEQQKNPQNNRKLKDENESDMIEDANMCLLRDEIAYRMWEDYQKILSRRQNRKA